MQLPSSDTKTTRQDNGWMQIKSHKLTEQVLPEENEHTGLYRGDGPLSQIASARADFILTTDTFETSMRPSIDAPV